MLGKTVIISYAISAFLMAVNFNTFPIYIITAIIFITWFCFLPD